MPDPDTAAAGIPSGAAAPQRVASIDIFRGLTMLVMVFVNEVSEVKGVPWWSRHAPANLDYMTYVDMVFPAFLFIMGASIPLAVSRRIAKGDSAGRLWWHAIVRSLSLVVLGLLLANLHLLDPRLTGIGATLWSAMAFTGVILLWNVYPRSGGHDSLYRFLKGAGALLLICAFATFRRKTEQGAGAWLDFSYWEILGLIGWAYLSACIIYLPLRKNVWILVASLFALNAMNVVARMGPLKWLWKLPDYVWPFRTGALVSIVMAGLITSVIFLDESIARTLKAKFICALGYAAILFAAGWALTPFGISKIRATPTWCLYCDAVNVLLFLVLYWLADVRRHTSWAMFVKPAGSNTLLTYLLPYILYALPGYLAIAAYWDQGWPGVIRSLLFTGLVLALAAVATRWKLRLQL
ncbi:MAG: DUF5009 domain-containing protein [Bryobacteraceae bacterium]